MVDKAIKMINDENADLILFTGDFVNNRFEEVKPWVQSFSKLKAKDDMISVLEITIMVITNDGLIKLKKRKTLKIS